MREGCEPGKSWHPERQVGGCGGEAQNTSSLTIGQTRQKTQSREPGEQHTMRSIPGHRAGWRRVDCRPGDKLRATSLCAKEEKLQGERKYIICKEVNETMLCIFYFPQ